MIISDMNYCQAITTDFEVMGARGRRYWGGSFSSKVTKVYQKVNAYAVAVNTGKGGSAIAFNETYQSITISN